MPGHHIHHYSTMSPITKLPTVAVSSIIIMILSVSSHPVEDSPQTDPFPLLGHILTPQEVGLEQELTEDVPQLGYVLTPEDVGLRSNEIPHSREENDDLLDLQLHIDTTNIAACSGAITCIAAFLRTSVLDLDHFTVAGYRFSRSSQLGETPPSWEYTGEDGYTAQLTWSQGSLYGHINLPHGVIFSIEPVDGGMHILKEEDQSAWKDGIHLYENEHTKDRSVEIPSYLAEQGRADRSSIATYTVTVYITKGFKAVTKNPFLFISQVIAETNQGYKNSGIPLRIALHCIQESNIPDGLGAYETLNRFTAMAGGDFNGLRKSADTTVLLTSHIADACGVNWFNKIGSGETIGVVKKDCALGYYSFGHEIGHGLGLHHDRRVAKHGSSSTPYAFGKVFQAGRFRSIMAYNQRGETRVNYYSSPSINFQGTMTGSQHEDNARVLSENRFAASAIGDESMQCSQGVTTAPTTTTTSPPTCRDWARNCKSYKNYCNARIVIKYCPKMCNHC